MSDAAMARQSGGLQAIALIAYGLFLVAPVNGLTAVAGVILLYLKRSEARGTPWQSHFSNLITVFWVGAILAAAALALILPGVATLLFSLATTNGNPPPALVGGLAAGVPILGFACLVFTIWYLYRVIAGLVRAVEGQPF